MKIQNDYRAIESYRKSIGRGEQKDLAQTVLYTAIAICIGLYGVLCYLGSAEVLKIYLSLANR